MTLSLGNADVTLIATTTNPALSTNAGDQLMLLRANVSNTGGSIQVTVWRVPAGGSTATGEIILEDFNVNALATARLPLAGTTLTQGQQLFASASTPSVANLNLSWCLL